MNQDMGQGGMLGCLDTARASPTPYPPRMTFLHTFRPRAAIIYLLDMDAFPSVM